MSNTTDAPTTPVPGTIEVRTPRRFFVGFSLVVLAIVLAGFARTFYLRAYFGTPDLTGEPGLPPHLLLHGTVLTAWFLLFVVQASLVASHRRDLHQRLGIAGAILAAAVVAVSIPTILLSFRDCHWRDSTLSWSHSWS